MKTSNFIGWESEKILKLWYWLVDINIDTYVQHGGMALENKEQRECYIPKVILSDYNFCFILIQKYLNWRDKKIIVK